MSARDIKTLMVVAAVCGLPVFLGIVLSSLGGTLVVLNQTPGARIENVRWVHPDGTQVGSSGSLLPGESTSLRLGYLSTDVPGVLSFELVVDGSRVLLNTTHKVQVPRRGDLNVAIAPALEVESPLSSATN